MNASESGSGPRLSRRRLVSAAAASGGAASLLAACGGGGEEPTAAEPGPVIKTSEVPVGDAVIVADREVIVSQPSEGTFLVFSTLCTHKKCPVDKIVDGTADCPCHGSRFNISDGSVAQGPATKSLTSVEFEVSDGEIVIPG